jgi:hypothetical protein
MTIEQFNERYAQYLEEGHYGLDIDNPSVINYLDELFKEITFKYPDFQYSQIKVKFGEGRFYNNLCEVMGSKLGRIITNEVERRITLLTQAHYDYLRYKSE